MLSTTDDLRIKELKELSTPEEVMREVPRTLLVSALRPMLDPLARVLAEEEVSRGEDEENGA